ncbi:MULTISPECIES: hypothetical protein [Rhodomicrobium]|uniref:hypothetical protein n=1 Tax=Rhodomicrobium TaxID=1068 RepID=UPI000F74038E|nr:MULTISPECIES: hypothetical protein [Rhodomicrobium]
MSETSDFLLFGFSISRQVNLEFSIGDVFTIVTILISAISVRNALRQRSEQVKYEHYSELDRFYADILTLAIHAPFLRTPRRIASDSEALRYEYAPYSGAAGTQDTQQTQYDAYAYMLWNFLETIHDRCATNPELKQTWCPVIAAENRIHRGWFLAEIRKEFFRQEEAKTTGKKPYPEYKFCAAFQKFVLDESWNKQSWAYDPEDDCRRTIDDLVRRENGLKAPAKSSLFDRLRIPQSA